ncbi:MAG: NUDIX domain-containing protein [Clostridia bacterium]|nr:NUDIX domain-containing protein [Clostridia bacterium]
MDTRPIRTSAKALVIRDGRMLALRLRDAGGEFYIMPGGGQRAGELLPEAARREVLEETGICVRVEGLAFVIEGAHGEPFHRVDLVFRCDYEGEDAGAARHFDINQTGVAWLDISTLNTAPLYPSRLRRAVMNLYESKPHAVYLGNEEAGDPEVTD